MDVFGQGDSVGYASIVVAEVVCSWCRYAPRPDDRPTDLLLE